MSNSTYVLILAGGAGTRFWPASRESLPKQFLDITGTGKSLIRETVDRFKEFIPVENIFVITHKKYGHLVQQVIPELTENQIILEPTRNNTAASIAYGSMKLAALNPDATCIVAPADHVIRDSDEFKRVVLLATKHANLNDSLITLGIEPTRPDTGYGYIEYDKNENEDVRKVKSFREKPDGKTAMSYLKTKSFAWNAGIFIWKLNTIVEAFQQHSPQIYNVLQQGETVYNTELENEFIEREYPSTEKISVDYAIMERADNVFTIPCDIGWSDVGTWNSLFEISEKDENGNAALSNPIILEDSHHSLVIASNQKLIVIKGLSDFIVVDTEDCLLIYPKSDEQEIKALKARLGQSGFDSYL